MIVMIIEIMSSIAIVCVLNHMQLKVHFKC